MKTAVVFYSYDGNCAFVAEELKARLNAELVRLYTKDEKRREGFAKYAWGGSQVLMRKKPALKPYAFDAAAYDLIIIGAPVWAGSPAPPVRTFLSDAKISGKKIAFFLCHAGGRGKAMDKLREMLAGNTIAAETDFTNPGSAGNTDAAKQRITQWVESMGAQS
jgi:flavodoxin